LDGQQLDVLAGDSDVNFGPGDVERRHMARFIVVSVDGHEVLIKFLAQEESSAHFDDAVGVFQPLIDSIAWN
jgi:hypothetical protein